MAEHFAEPFEVLSAVAAPAAGVEAVPEVVAAFPAFGIVAEAEIDVAAVVAAAEVAEAERVWFASVEAGIA